MGEQPKFTERTPGDGSDLIDTILYYGVVIVLGGIVGIITATVMAIQMSAALGLQFEVAGGLSIFYLALLAGLYRFKIGMRPTKPTNELVSALALAFPFIMAFIGGIRGFIIGAFWQLFLVTFISAVLLGMIAFIILTIAGWKQGKTWKNYLTMAAFFIVAVVSYAGVMGWMWLNNWI